MANTPDDERRKQATDFVKAKATELAEYMVTQGWGYEVTASVLLGMAIGWMVRERGLDVARKGADLALSAAKEMTERGPNN